MNDFDFIIGMAGLTIAIRPKYQHVYNLCRDYRIQSDKFDLVVSATDEEIGAQMVADKGHAYAEYCEALCIYRKICLELPAFDGFLIHGAAVAVDGAAYLFLAPSGVGKSTHIQLWQAAFGEQAQVINGDKPILRRFGGQWCVCGTPWCGKEKLGCNRIVPLKAVCFLERGGKNSLSHLERKEAMNRIFHQLLLPRNEKQMTAFMALLEDLLITIPCYNLRCNQQQEAAVIAYSGMNRENSVVFEK